MDLRFLKIVPADEFLTKEHQRPLFVCDNLDFYPDFESWEAVEGQSELVVCEIVQDGSFKELFGSLSSDPSKLCLAPSQFWGFAKNYHNLWSGGYGVFFLFKISSNQFFVADVYAMTPDRSKFCVHVFSFGDTCIFTSDYPRRIVVPYQG